MVSWLEEPGPDSVAAEKSRGVACDFRYTINLNGDLTINYLDTSGGPLSPLHLAFSAGLCLLFCGSHNGDEERRALRHAMIVENLQQLYTDVFNDWILANEEAAEELR